MKKIIQIDIANETARHYGALENDFSEKLVRRIRRKFKTKLEVNEVSVLAGHYKDIYAVAAKVLKDCLLPRTEKYADPKDIDHIKYMKLVGNNFPNDEKDILEKITGWAIYWEYLR